MTGETRKATERRMINETLIDTPPQLWRTSELLGHTRRLMSDEAAPPATDFFLALNTLTLALARAGRTARAAALLDTGIATADRLMRHDPNAVRYGVECVINHADLLRYAGDPRAATLLREIHDLSGGHQEGRTEILGVDLVRGRDADPTVLGMAMFMLRLRSQISLLKTLVAAGAEADALAVARRAADDHRGTGGPLLDSALDYLAGLDPTTPVEIPAGTAAGREWNARALCALLRAQHRQPVPILPVAAFDEALDTVVAGTALHNPRTPLLWRIAFGRAVDLADYVEERVGEMREACVAADDKRMYERAMLFAARSATDAGVLFTDPRPDPDDLDALANGLARCADGIEAAARPAA